MKKVIKKIALLLIVFGIGVGVMLLFTNNKYKVYEEEESKQIKKHVDTISMMLETEAGSGNYEMTTTSSWPTEGYVFNATLSKCENGGELSWDDTNKRVVMSGNVSDKCYVYFDVYVPPTVVSDVCNGGETLSTCITTLSQNSTSSYTNIYHHTSTLTNGAGDNSYRYAGGDYVLTEAGKATGATMMIGYNNTVTTALIDFYCNGTKQYVGYVCDASQAHYYLIKGDTTQYQTYKETLNKAVEKGYLTKDNVKNFVCFGSTASPCPTDNLYRIIGVFGNNVKLIKYDYANSNLLGTNGDYSTSTYTKSSISSYKGNLTTINRYYWNNSTQKNTWSESNLNKVNLNANFITNIGAEWAQKIATTTWKVGGNTYANIIDVVPATAYQNEIVNPVTTNTTDNKTEYTAKIGLMYVSDYGFAAEPSAWTLIMSRYINTIATSTNWMYMGLEEWTISRTAADSNYAFYVYYTGGVSYGRNMDFYDPVRPVFYLESSITYKSGSGTQSDPILIN